MPPSWPSSPREGRVREAISARSTRRRPPVESSADAGCANCGFSLSQRSPATSPDVRPSRSSASSSASPRAPSGLHPSRARHSASRDATRRIRNSRGRLTTSLITGTTGMTHSPSDCAAADNIRRARRTSTGTRVEPNRPSVTGQISRLFSVTRKNVTLKNARFARRPSRMRKTTTSVFIFFSTATRVFVRKSSPTVCP